MTTKKRKSSKRRTKKSHKTGIRNMKELQAKLKLRKHTKRGKK